MTKTKIVAKPVLKDTFWIAYDKAGTKIGTISWTGQEYLYFDNIAEEQKNLEADDIIFEDTLLEESQEVTTEARAEGFPTDSKEVFNVEKKTIKSDGDSIEVVSFTKKANGKRLYAAGYHVLHFPKTGYTEAFCPTFKNLEENYAAGPYKTEADMKIIAKGLKNKTL